MYKYSLCMCLYFATFWCDMFWLQVNVSLALVKSGFASRPFLLKKAKTWVTINFKRLFNDKNDLKVK